MQLLLIVSYFVLLFFQYCWTFRFLSLAKWPIFRIENISNKKLNISYYRSNFQQYQKNRSDLLVKSYKCNNYEVFKTFKDF